jgi:hypothetical protein
MKTILCAVIFLLPAGAAELKTGDAVLDRFVEVTGGLAAYGKMHNTVMKGTMTMAAMGVKGAVTIYAAEPNKVSMVTEIAGVGKIVEGSDGTNGWTFSAMQGPQLKKGEELNESLREALFHKETQWKSIYASAELQGTEDFDGKAAYKVVMTPKSGKPESNYYDKESGLMIHHKSIRSTPFGEIPVDVTIGGYRRDCGVLLPHSMTQTVAGQKIDLELDSIQCNVDLPADAFAPPAEVKALMAK